MKKSWIVSAIILLCSASGIAETQTEKKSEINTQQCIPLEINSENKEIILPGPEEARKNKLYVVKNLTDKSIWLDHPVLHPSASAGWSSYLRKNNASALIVNRKNFNLNCAVIKPGKVDYLDCAKAVSICSPKEVLFKSSRKGTYWIAEDQSWEELMKTLDKRGLMVK